MQYSFSPRLKMASLILIAVGAVIYGIGLFLNIQDQNDPHFIENMVSENPEAFYGEFQSAEFQHFIHNEKVHEEHMNHLEYQLANRYCASFLVHSYYYFRFDGEY